MRKIEKRDLDFLIKVDMADEGITNSHASYESCKKKMTTFIEDPNFGGFIIENKAVILFSIENKNKTYDWPTVYKEIDDTYFDSSKQMMAVYQLWVDPNYRRRGYATMLKRQLEVEALTRQIVTLYTHTETNKQDVIDLNIKLGYVPVRIGPIWDDVLRISLIKDLRKNTAMSMLASADVMPCLIDAESLKCRLDEDLQVLDIRYEEDAREKFIPGSIFCHWHQVHKLVKSGQLKKDREVIVVCYTGQSSMHVACLLNLLGYKAVSLLDGMEKY